MCSSYVNVPLLLVTGNGGTYEVEQGGELGQKPPTTKRPAPPKQTAPKGAAPSSSTPSALSLLLIIATGCLAVKR